jgi:hypothetical protein
MNGVQRALLSGVTATVAVLLACAGLVRADDFWRNKPPTEWSLKQTLKLLEDSPWSRQEVRSLPRADSGPDALNDSRNNCSLDRMDVSGNCPPPRPAGSPRTSRPDPSENSGNNVIFLVRWESSAPIADAFAHLSEIGERATAQYLSIPPRLPADRYVVTLKALDKAGPVGQPRGSMPADPIGSLDGDATGPRARLIVGGVVVPAAETERAGVGAAEAAHFFFPREVNGVPVIPPNRPVRVVFEFRGQRFSVATHFSLDPETLR